MDFTHFDSGCSSNIVTVAAQNNFDFRVLSFHPESDSMNLRMSLGASALDPRNSLPVSRSLTDQSVWVADIESLDITSPGYTPSQRAYFGVYFDRQHRIEVWVQVERKVSPRISNNSRSTNEVVCAFMGMPVDPEVGLK